MFRRVSTAPSRFSDAELDALRLVGDPLADDLVEEIFAAHAIDGVRALLRHCVDNAHPLEVRKEDALPPEIAAHVLRYFERSEAALPDTRQEILERGQDLFARAGPEILLILACYSLPAAYAARKGVQVLAQTDRLGSSPNRRLFETTQMVIDVLSPGGLERGTHPTNHGRGIRTAQKVRLMHAAIRRMIVHHRGPAWVAEFGVPINQEDMAGTLMTFSWIVLDGLDRMGIPTTPEERAAYLETWKHVAHVLGLKAELLPADLAEAERLTRIIQARQIAPSPEGRYMARALLDMMRGELLYLLNGLPPALLRFFLREHADVIDVPKASGSVILVRLIHYLARLFDRLASGSPLASRLYRALNLGLMQAMVDFERGGKRTSFDIPDHLAERWRLPPRIRDRATGGRALREA